MSFFCSMAGLEKHIILPHCRVSGSRNTRRASLPGKSPEPQQEIAAAAGRRQSAGRRRSEPALVHDARAAVLAGKAFLMTVFEEGAVRRRVHKLISDYGGSVIDSIPHVQSCPSAHGTHGHCEFA